MTEDTIKRLLWIEINADSLLPVPDIGSRHGICIENLSAF